MYIALMELQTQINELKSEVAQLKAMLNGGSPRFKDIFCSELTVSPIKTSADDNRHMVCGRDGFNGIQWYDREGILRIELGTEHWPASEADGEFFIDGRAYLKFEYCDDPLFSVWTCPDGRAGVVLPE